MGVAFKLDHQLSRVFLCRCEKSAPPPDPRLFTVRPKTETSRRRSVKRAAHAESTTDAAATLNDAPSEEHDAPSLDTFAPCTESIEEAYDVDGADVDFTAASISIEDVIHIISPGAHTPPGISIDSCD